PPVSPATASPYPSTHTLEPKGITLGSTAITFAELSFKFIPVAETPEHPEQSGPYAVASIVISLPPEDDSDELESSNESADDFVGSAFGSEFSSDFVSDFSSDFFSFFGSGFGSSFVPTEIISFCSSSTTFLFIFLCFTSLSFSYIISFCSSSTTFSSISLRFTSLPFSYVTSYVLTTVPSLPSCFVSVFPFSNELSSSSSVSNGILSSSFSSSFLTFVIEISISSLTFFFMPGLFLSFFSYFMSFSFYI